MARDAIEINRAPVFTLWSSIVAERLGYDHDAALTLGKAVAGLNAQSKGRRLGIYKPSEKPKAKPRRGEEFRVELCGRAVPAKQTDDGIRAVSGAKVITPESVESYLCRSFGGALPDVRDAMVTLAKRFKPDELKEVAFGLYEQFRPSIPSGVRGWGAKGKLDLELIRSLGSGKKKPAVDDR